MADTVGKLQRIRRKFWSVHPVDVWSWDLSSEPILEDPDQFVVHRITSADDPVLARLDQDTFDLEYYRKCLMRGDMGFAALDGTACVSRQWSTRRSHRDGWSGLRVTLGPDEAFYFGAWVDTTHRNKGIASFVAVSLARELRRNGVAKVFTTVESGNVPPQKVMAKLGWQREEHTRFVRVLNRWGIQVPFSVRPRTGPLAGGKRPRAV